MMKKKIYIGLIFLIISFLVYYYWLNRYVEFRPVILEEENYTPKLMFFNNDNDLYKFAKPNEVSPNYYKNIKWVLDRSGQPYILKNGKIYVRNHYLQDMNLIWNYTTRTTSLEFFEQEKETDSINLIYEKEYVDSQKIIINSYLKALPSK